MSIIVAKFGGSSLSDAGQFKKVKHIIELNPDRRFIVPSAPGKRDSDDIKITDLLYKCGKCGCQDFDAAFAPIAQRYNAIKDELNLNLDLDHYLNQVKTNIKNGASKYYIASRGEYLNGLLLSNYLGYEFVDAAQVIFFFEDGRFNFDKTNKAIQKVLLSKKNAVVPGFYGSFPDGSVATFSRGGSDVTGSLITRGVKADLYENWTDVSGFMKADPRIVDNPKVIKKLSYNELRELSYMGASVLHEDSTFPLRDAGIPIRVLNTNHPEDEGTLIVREVEENCALEEITGIAGKKNFTVVDIEKDMMNAETGFVRKVLSVLEMLNISFEHMPTGIDSISLIISDDELKGKREDMVEAIERTCEPDKIKIHTNMALIATVGHGMAYAVGIAGKLFTGLAKADVNIRMIDQGSSEINIIVGVENDDFEKSISAIYDTFEK